MKRSILLGILSLSTIAITTARAVNGGIYITNYQEPYNPVVWGVGPRTGLGVLSTEGVSLTLWWGEGSLTAGQLTHQTQLSWNMNSEPFGYPGFYYSPGQVLLPDWDFGDTYTFQVRAHGSGVGQSVTWTESNDIHFVGGIPPTPPGVSHQSIGFTVVPEPSVFALTAMGVSGLMFFRRHN